MPCTIVGGQCCHHKHYLVGSVKRQIKRKPFVVELLAHSVQNEEVSELSDLADLEFLPGPILVFSHRNPATRNPCRPRLEGKPLSGLSRRQRV